jgi:hypothetical protein
VNHSSACFYLWRITLLLQFLIFAMQDDRENILRAPTGKFVPTSPFRLLGSHHLGVVLTFPVYKFKLPPNPTTEELIKATAGYILISLCLSFLFLESFFLCFI